MLEANRKTLICAIQRKGLSHTRIRKHRRTPTSILLWELRETTATSRGSSRLLHVAERLLAQLSLKAHSGPKPQ